MSYKEMPTKDVIECDDVWKLKTGGMYCVFDELNK